MNDIMKIVQSLEESGLLIKDVGKSIKNKAVKQKWRFLGMLLSKRTEIKWCLFTQYFT